MRAQARGARPASSTARACAGPGRRGRPLILNGSNSNPASGTTRASMRPGEPAKLTLTPRARSACATASDGITWPAVPPAAITHLSPDSDAIAASDVKEHAHGREQHDEAGPSVGHQGE